MYRLPLSQSDQRIRSVFQLVYYKGSYLHKNIIIFLVIIFILKHVVFRLMQKYFSPLINCLLCFILVVSFADRIVFVHVRIVSYGCKILQPYVEVTVRMHSDAVLSSTVALLMKTVIKVIVNNKWSIFVSAGFGCRIHVNQPIEEAVPTLEFFSDPVLGKYLGKGMPVPEKSRSKICMMLFTG